MKAIIKVTAIPSIVTTVVKQILTLVPKMPFLATLTIQPTEMTVNHEQSTHFVRPVAKRTTPQRNAILELMQQIDSILGTKVRWERIRINDRTYRTMQIKVFRVRRKEKIGNATSSLRSWQTGDHQKDKTSTNSRDYLAATYGVTCQPLKVRENL